MHLPSRVQWAQSAAPHAASEQFPAQKTSRWLMRQSFSDVQEPSRPMQAPSGQLVHHLQRGIEAWGVPRTGSTGPSLSPCHHDHRDTLTHLSISGLQAPGVTSQALTAGPKTAAFLWGAGHWRAGGTPTAQPGETGGLVHKYPGPFYLRGALPSDPQLDYNRLPQPTSPIAPCPLGLR